jgi:hypothetical protein
MSYYAGAWRAPNRVPFRRPLTRWFDTPSPARHSRQSLRFFSFVFDDQYEFIGHNLLNSNFENRIIEIRNKTELLNKSKREQFQNEEFGSCVLNIVVFDHLKLFRIRIRASNFIASLN